MEKYLIPFRDISLQYKAHKDEIDEAVQKVLTGGKYIGGEAVRTFERSLANYLGVKHVISCANGTDALRIALMTIGKDDGIALTPNYSFVSAVEAATLHGMDIQLCDVREEDGNIDIAKYESIDGPVPDVIIPVHLFGRPCCMNAVTAYAHICSTKVGKHPYIIEDNAQSLGSWYNGRKAGTIGDVGITSFFPTKNLACFGDGGALFTNDDLIAGVARQIRNHGRDFLGAFLNVGLNSRLDAIQAAILSVNLKYLDEEILMRREIARDYDAVFFTLDGILTPDGINEDGMTVHTYNHYTIRLNSKRERNELLQHLLKNDIETRVYYPNLINEHPAYSDINVGLDFPTAKALSETTLSLPIHPYMPYEMVHQVIYHVSEWIEKHYEKNK